MGRPDIFSCPDFFWKMSGPGDLVYWRTIVKPNYAMLSNCSNVLTSNTLVVNPTRDTEFPPKFFGIKNWTPSKIFKDFEII